MSDRPPERRRADDLDEEAFVADRRRPSNAEIRLAIEDSRQDSTRAILGVERTLSASIDGLKDAIGGLVRSDVHRAEHELLSTKLSAVEERARTTEERISNAYRLLLTSLILPVVVTVLGALIVAAVVTTR